MTEGQRLALEQLRSVEAVDPGALEVLSIDPPETQPGAFRVEVAIRCKDLPRSAEGLPLRDRERFHLYIPSDFPFALPKVRTVHTRFAEFSHVQWGRELCLFRAPDTEWNPNDGLFGFLDRLGEFLRDGAQNELDAIGVPLHPPVAYPSVGKLVVPRADTPDVGDRDWFGTAHLRTVSQRRVDVVGWSKLFEDDTPEEVAAAVLLSKPLTFFEFPTEVEGLVSALEQHGIPRRMLLLTLQAAALHNKEEQPLYVVIGAPMRGVQGSGELKQHLTVWYVRPEVADALRISLEKYSDREALQKIGNRAEALVWEWAAKAPVGWCAVREDRKEVTVRRDHDAPISVFRDRDVAIWGCGALGGHIAEYLARGGVQKLILRDSSSVGPGVLARQPFDDSDIGRNKALALAERLQRIRPSGLEVEAHACDVLLEPLGDEWAEADLIIDATASRRVLEKLERRWKEGGSARAPVISMVVGHRAENGLVVVAKAIHSGGPADVTRQAKLVVGKDKKLKPFREEFWPDPGERGRGTFQPEPGCSEPTFIGSAADLSSLAAIMLNLAAQALRQEDTTETALAYLVNQPHSHLPEETVPRSTAFHWGPDRCVHDGYRGYEIRVSDTAWLGITKWIRRSRRLRGARVETGGLLFGERDDAARVVWVTEASGPPPDSQASRTGFLCGTVGTQALNEKKRRQSCGSVQFVGMWHTHPDGPPLPSPTDQEGMTRLLSDLNRPTPQPLLLIVGNAASAPTLGAFLYNREQLGGQELYYTTTPLGLMAAVRTGLYTLAVWSRGDIPNPARSWYKAVSSLFDRFFSSR